MSAPGTVALPGLRAPAELLAEIGDLKRVRRAGAAGSVADRRFLGAWGALAAGEPVRAVALRETAAAVVGTRLGAIDRAVLVDAGLDEQEAEAVLTRAFDAAATPVEPALRSKLRAQLGQQHGEAEPPPFALALADQPRAGATHPTRPRLMLEPAESHAAHCWVTAVGAVLLAPAYGAAIEQPFLCALAHHAHNATLPDSGFAGEALLGAHLGAVVDGLAKRALAQLPPALRQDTIAARALLGATEQPPERAFHAADVLDRVLEMRHHARVAAFTLEQALDDLDLVHTGPLQAFGLEVVAEAGL